MIISIIINNALRNAIYYDIVDQIFLLSIYICIDNYMILKNIIVYCVHMLSVLRNLLYVILYTNVVIYLIQLYLFYVIYSTCVLI